MPYTNPDQVTAIFLDIKRRKGLPAAEAWYAKEKAAGNLPKGAGRGTHAKAARSAHRHRRRQNARRP